MKIQYELTSHSFCFVFECHTILSHTVLESKWRPEEWRSVLVLIFKSYGDVQSCSNYRSNKADEPYHEDMGKSCSS